MSWFSNALFGQNPASAAQPYYNQISPMLEQSFNPYIERGNNAANQTQGIYSNMAEDPMAYLDQIYQGYKPSSGYQAKEDRLRKLLGATAASGGYRGGQQDQEQQSRLISSLMDEDMQQFINNVLGIQGTGLEGQGEFAKTGYNASTNLAQGKGDVLGAQADLAYQGQAQKNQNKASLINNFMRMAAAMGTGGMSELGQLFGKGGGNVPIQAGGFNQMNSNYQNPLAGWNM